MTYSRAGWMGFAVRRAFLLAARVRGRARARGRRGRRVRAGRRAAALQRAPQPERRLHAALHLASGGANDRSLSAHRRRSVRLLAPVPDRARSRRRTERLSRAQHLSHVFCRNGAAGDGGVPVGLLELRARDSRAFGHRAARRRIAGPRADGGTRRRRRARPDRYHDRRDFRNMAPDHGLALSAARHGLGKPAA